ncbi:5'-adenylylsulfate reductase-like 5 isoform X1 [Cornus florida]|uniref:5'-adenylylsulfate reductase-like 5 isoform X1 n=1 Tax=Cornus florida TaxID=4283 RepID=UPI00289C9D58|nr:5'-adenylylsulfate reductase-like 5 isoform X1 [Cornus florida]
MATSTPYLLFICICAVYALRRVSSSSISMCPHQSSLFINALRFQCPLSFPPNSPLQVDGDFLDRTLTSIRGNVQTSVLFYASWCPFSRTAHSKFEALASMFPQIDHLAVEQSSAMPSVISRYGIHGLPTILIVNQTSRTRFCGSKDLRSLVKFYEKTTGFEPVQNAHVAQPIKLRNSEKFVMQSWTGSSLNKILAREPYLVLSTLFICLRILVHVCPKAMSHFKGFWVSFVSHFNMEMFGGGSQILGRVVHLIDAKRAWTKLKLCKTRNFHDGAKNARVWASSLTSVSLGEASSSRSCS